MLHLLSCCLAAFADPAGTSAGDEPTSSSADSSFDAILEEAKQLYFQGEPQLAREKLQGLQLRLYAGEMPPWDSAVEALTYLGEIYYVQGNQEQAENVFRYILERDAETPISPYHHTIEVVTLFELIRAKVIEIGSEPDPEPEPVPAPLSTYLPLGIPELAQGRTALGVLYGGLQAGFGISSLVLYIQADQLNNPETPLDEQADRVDRLKLYQGPATYGFYTFWAISAIDAARWHQRHRGRQRPITALPAPSGVVIGGRF